MPVALRLPSRLASAPTPLFAMCWYADPADGTSILAACGGGGSAATGVKNHLVLYFGLRDDTDPVIVNTANDVGVAVTIAKNPINNKISLFCALGSKVQVYSLSSGQANLEQQLEVGDGVNALAANAMVDSLAVGCESGTVKVYKISQDEHQLEGLASYECEGHGQAVCSVAFAPRSNLMVSSAKDGTARLWQQDACLAVLNCTINDPGAPVPNRPPKVLVRGCGFGDLEGKLVYTVASGRRGAAYLAKWGPKDDQNDYQCIERSQCSQHPVSAMSISGDASTVALGATNGTVILWDTQKWKAIKSFPEVHDLPVTCIAARPFDVPLQGEDQSLVKYNAICASADSKIGWLTLQRRNPKRTSGGAGSGFPLAKYVNLMMKMALLYWIASPLARDIWETCGGEDMPGIGSKLQCIRDDILIAPISRPGIAVPPH
ncbi:WD repeat-containing protein [Nitzschia inconspicua]|uniref:WD repeat-containing protein n=1 Tax=Nitzschia inconspicua TaxID=303405 RepID=A0A9K3PPS1_9STRA|nr:WD repeat-containing protein [Nitzschia inconspicua]